MPFHDVIKGKLKNLPKDAGRLLDTIAVSGQALLLAEASKAAGHDAPAVSTITHMRTEKLVRLVGSEENASVDTYHDKIRETVIREMDDEVRKRTHLALARTIETDAAEGLAGLTDSLTADDEQKEGSEDVTDDVKDAHPRLYDLAYHFDAAGEKEMAWKYAVLAAEQARRQFALEVSAEQYAIAKRNAAETAEAIRYRIAVGSGEALMLLGRYPDAAKQLEGAGELVEAPVKKAAVEALQGEIAFKQSDPIGGIAFYESGLRRLGVRTPRTIVGFAVALLRETVIQGIHTVFPSRLHSQASDRRLVLINKMFNNISQLYAFSNMLKMMWATTSGMNRAERLPPSPELAFNYAIHGGLASLLGWFSRAQNTVTNRSLSDVKPKTFGGSVKASLGKVPASTPPGATKRESTFSNRRSSHSRRLATLGNLTWLVFISGAAITG